MNTRLPLFYAVLVILAATMSSCQVIGDIFKAGVWTGLILVVLFIGIIIWVIGKMSGRR